MSAEEKDRAAAAEPGLANASPVPAEGAPPPPARFTEPAIPFAPPVVPPGPSPRGEDDEAGETGPVPFLDRRIPFGPWDPPAPAKDRRRLAGWALVIAVVGLAASLFVGWGFPIGVVAVVVAAMALRRPEEGRQAAAWALALGILSIIYSAIWIVWAAMQADLFA
ncbi:hypothetical protein ACIGCK_06020 [Microbacterium sp. NPDC078428]|uniref:hypothetical protein n=1 Tax=Microbacterium sp. NPDC078428 TaxID=3364190 RepID=UPI0037C79D2F